MRQRTMWRTVGAFAASAGLLLVGQVASAQTVPPTQTTTTSTTHHTTATSEVLPPEEPCTGASHEVQVGVEESTQETVTTTLSTGPSTVLVGEDQSEEFFVAAGTTNLNTNTHTETFVHTTYQTVCDDVTTTTAVSADTTVPVEETAAAPAEAVPASADYTG
ncbi:MAG: hypothetical protein U0P45_12070 [Acidimicrobiales bacterium]